MLVILKLFTFNKHGLLLLLWLVNNILIPTYLKVSIWCYVIIISEVESLVLKLLLKEYHQLKHDQDVIKHITLFDDILKA